MLISNFWKKDTQSRKKVVYSLLWPMTLAVIAVYLYKNRKEIGKE
jgi:hypothetical protein